VKFRACEHKRAGEEFGSKHLQGAEPDTRLLGAVVEKH